jgi:hypothetical protein
LGWLGGDPKDARSEIAIEAADSSFGRKRVASGFVAMDRQIGHSAI